MTGASSSAPIFLPESLTSLFALGLPELISPTESVIGAEAIGWKGREQLAQLDLVIERDRKIEHRVIPPKDAGERAAGESAREIETIACSQVPERAPHIPPSVTGTEPLASSVMRRLFSVKKAGEQQSMPVLIRCKFAEMMNVLSVGTADRGHPRALGLARGDDCGAGAALHSCGTRYSFSCTARFSSAATHANVRQDAGVGGDFFEQLTV